MHYSGRAIIDPDNPSSLGICDRCGNMWNLRDLVKQFQWQGTRMQDLHLRVCEDCLDDPSEFLRALVIPPDPPSVNDPRIENYALDEE